MLLTYHMLTEIFITFLLLFVLLKYFTIYFLQFEKMKVTEERAVNQSRIPVEDSSAELEEKVNISCWRVNIVSCCTLLYQHQHL